MFLWFTLHPCDGVKLDKWLWGYLCGITTVYNNSVAALSVRNNCLDGVSSDEPEVGSNLHLHITFFRSISQKSAECSQNRPCVCWSCCRLHISALAPIMLRPRLGDRHVSNVWQCSEWNIFREVDLLVPFYCRKHTFTMDRSYSLVSKCP